MKPDYISWEHYEADRSRVSVWKEVGFGLVFWGLSAIIGLSILIFYEKIL